MVTVECICGTTIHVAESRIKAGGGKYCSQECYWAARYGEKRAVERVCPCGETFSTFKNSGRDKYCSRECFHEYYQRRSGLEYEIKVVNKGWFKTTGNYHCQKEAYQAVHIWIRRHRIKPDACVFCGAIKKLDWANISGEYKRDVSDWIALCRSCHIRLDRNIGDHYGHTSRFELVERRPGDHMIMKLRAVKGLPEDAPYVLKYA